MTRCWMVRAGRGGRYFQDFRERSMVAIGWSAIPDVGKVSSRSEMTELVKAGYPNYREQAAIVAAEQLYRFARDFTIGDRIVTYDTGARKYLCGNITGEYHYRAAEENEEYLNQRTVSWSHEKPKDELSSTAQNSLGAILTIFSIPEVVAAELWNEAVPRRRPQLPEAELDVSKAIPAPEELSDGDIQELASEAIKDRIAELTWQDMQELVAGLLRAMGYKTTVSPPGADRGKDIMASPDGFGFLEPRIVVEVKHRRSERMGSQEIRSFLGGRHPKDKGLYVSTGGFSRDAYYEAERANIPITLMDFEGLVDAILDNYPSLDEKTKQILPLRRLYWPIQK